MKSSDEMDAAFRNLMDVLAQDVIMAPWVWAGPVNICREDPQKIYNKHYKASKEYMSRMKEG